MAYAYIRLSRSPYPVKFVQTRRPPNQHLRQRSRNQSKKKVGAEDGLWCKITMYGLMPFFDILLGAPYEEIYQKI